MRLVTYRDATGLRAGFQVGQRVVAATAAASSAGIGGAVEWTSVRGLLGVDRRSLAEVEAVARDFAGGGGPSLELSEVSLAAPIPDPDKVVCLGLNYRDHAEEAGLSPPPAPMLFAKFRNSLVGPADPIVIPPHTECVDYEGELAVVIGRVCAEVDEDEALDYVAGAMPINDVTARDLQHQTSQWMAGKAIDTFAPCGPALVTLDEIGDLQRLAVRTRLNGQTVQDGNTREMIFSVAATIAFLSRLMTLVPGDIVATGTPAGVGFTRTPPLLLAEGDLVEVEVEGLGATGNRLVAKADAESLAGASH